MTNALAHLSPRAAWTLILVASAVMMITTGTRLTSGLFLSPLNTATGLGVATISFVMAVAQLMWGVAQPVFGAVADKYGPGRVIALGGVMLAVGTAATPFVGSEWALLLTMAMASLGIDTNVTRMKQAGWRPVLLGAGLFVHLVLIGGLVNWLAA